MIVFRGERVLIGLLVATTLWTAGCGDDSPTPPTAPTPAPAPAPAPTPAPTPPPAAPAALQSIAFNPSTVQGQTKPIATVTLTAAAPANNASVKIESSNPTVAKVPANVSVAAGETTNAFAIDTSTVRDTTMVTISATYESVTVQAVLTVTPPPLVARFTVSSPSKGNDGCTIVSAAGAIDCVFDASASEGFVASYRWTFTIKDHDFTANSPEGSPTLTPLTDCNFLSGGTVNNGTVSMVAVLRLQDRQGNQSSPVQKTLELVPNGMCGY